MRRVATILGTVMALVLRISTLLAVGQAVAKVNIWRNLGDGYGPAGSNYCCRSRGHGRA